MDITFEIPYAFNPDASQVDNACALRALLDLQIALGLAYLRYHPAPALYASGVVYGRTTVWEPYGALILPNKHAHRSGDKIIWNPLGMSGGKKRADCKSLAPALVAQYRHAGKKAACVFRFNPRVSGYLDFHILVQFPNGTFEDPSERLGMDSGEIKWFERS